MTFLGGEKYSVEMLRSMGAGDLLTSMFEFSEKLAALNLREEEMSLFTAVVLVSAGQCISRMLHGNIFLSQSKDPLNASSRGTKMLPTISLCPNCM